MRPERHRRRIWVKVQEISGGERGIRMQVTSPRLVTRPDGTDAQNSGERVILLGH